METKVTSFSRVLGFKDVSVEYENEGLQPDDPKFKQPETVRVFAIRVKQCQAYAASLQDECARAELVCRKEKGWADTLHRESAIAILDADSELNADFFSLWVRRQRALAETLVPGSMSALINAASRLPNGSPKSA